MTLVPLEQLDDVERLRSIVESLWRLLDNIDTADDAARDNDVDFRRYALAQASRRFEFADTDGYALFVRQYTPNP